MLRHVTANVTDKSWEDPEQQRISSIAALTQLQIWHHVAERLQRGAESNSLAIAQMFAELHFASEPHRAI